MLARTDNVTAESCKQSSTTLYGVDYRGTGHVRTDLFTEYKACILVLSKSVVIWWKAERPIRAISRISRLKTIDTNAKTTIMCASPLDNRG